MLYTEQIGIIRSHQDSAPVQMVPLANALGVKVYKVQGWPETISGMIKKDNKSDSGYSIYIKAEDPETRRRFTIAHELGHLIKHKEQIGDGIADDAMYRSGLSSRRETEANEMAADILMPWRLISNLQDAGHTSVEALARELNVSEQAMSIRLGRPY